MSSFVGSTNVLSAGSTIVVLGSLAGSSLIAGVGLNNTLVGCGSGPAISSGTGNVVAGSTSCAPALSTGSSNVFVGANSGTLRTVDSGSVVMGSASYLAADGGTVTHNTVVGYGSGVALSTGTGNILVGNSVGYTFNTGNRNVVIGNTAGALSTAGSESVLIGFAAGSSLTGNTLTVVGFEACKSVTNSNGTYVGYRAGYSCTGGNGTTAVGHSAGSGFVGTTAVTAIGYKAAQYNSDGDYCTFVGSHAGEGVAGTPMTAQHNCVVGSYASPAMQGGATANTIIGANAANLLTTGSYNTCVGNNTGGYFGTGITTGSSNTCMGHDAGLTGDMAAATNCTLLGDQAKITSAVTTNATALGSDALAFANGTCILGNGVRVVETSPCKIYRTTPKTYAGNNTLAATDILGGILIFAGGTQQMCTAADIIATLFCNQTTVGMSFDVHVVNTAASTLTFTVNTNVTYGGVTTIPANQGRRISIRLSTSSAAVVYI